MWVIGFTIFAYLFEKGTRYLKEEQEYKNKKVVIMSSYDDNPVFDNEVSSLEDIMFDTGASEEELDEIMPDIDRDLEEWL